MLGTLSDALKFLFQGCYLFLLLLGLGLLEKMESMMS